MGTGTTGVSPVAAERFADTPILLRQTEKILYNVRHVKSKEKHMAMPQRDDWIEEIKRLDALLEYAVMHGDEAEAERLRAALRKLTEEF